MTMTPPLTDAFLLWAYKGWNCLKIYTFWWNYVQVWNRATYSKVFDTSKWCFAVVPHSDQRHCGRLVKYHIYSIQLKTYRERKSDFTICSIHNAGVHARSGQKYFTASKRRVKICLHKSKLRFSCPPGYWKFLTHTASYPSSKLEISVIQYSSEHCPLFQSHDDRKIQWGSMSVFTGQAINFENLHSMPWNSHLLGWDFAVMWKFVKDVSKPLQKIVKKDVARNKILWFISVSLFLLKLKFTLKLLEFSNDWNFWWAIEIWELLARWANKNFKIWPALHAFKNKNKWDTR